MLLHMLFLIILPIRALFITRFRGDLGLLADVKEALRPSVIYVILVTGMIFVYYNFANPEFIRQLRIETEQKLLSSVPDDKSYEAMQKKDPFLRAIDRNEYLEQKRQLHDTIFSLELLIPLSLLSLSVVAAIFGLIVTVFFRALYRKYLG